MTLSDEQIQELLRVGNPTDEEFRLIRIGWDAAMRGKNAMSVPDGWKLIPIEPTPSMAASIELSTANSVSEIYCAMIAAAPEAKP